jgi:hypothetical protein
VSSRLPFLCAASAAGMFALAACEPGLDLRPYTIDTRDAEGRPTGARVAHDINGTWFAAIQDVPGVFTFVPTHEHVAFVVACPAGLAGRVEVWFEHETLPPPTSVRTLPRSCVDTRPETAGEVQFTVIPAEASLGLATDDSAGGDGRITLRVPPGPTDLVAMAGTRLLVQRGVVFDAAVPYVVDLVADGVELVPLALGLPASAPGETVTTAYRFSTWRGASAGDGGGRIDLRIAPDSVLQGGDWHEIEVSARRGRSRRWVKVSVGETSLLDVPLYLIPTFDDVDATWDDRPQVRWTGRPADDSDWIRIQLRQDGEPAIRWGAGFSADWLALRDQDRDGSWSPPDLSSVRGWDAAWNLDRSRRESTRWAVDSFVGDPIELFVDRQVMRGADWGGSFGGAADQAR